MTALAETYQATVERSSWLARQRARAASFWLALLFRLTAGAPIILGIARPVLVRCAFIFSTKIRQSTRANAAHILGAETIARQRRNFALGVVGSFYDFISDIGQGLRQTHEQLAARIESAEGESAYHITRAAGKGAILLTAHMGSFEVGLVALAKHEKRIHVVFKRDQVGGFERLRSQLRSRLGILEAPIDDGYTGWAKLRIALQNDEVVAIQGDRVMPGQKGLVAPVLGGHLLLPTGPFKLALASGCPLIPIFSVRSPTGRICIFLEQAIIVSHDRDGIEHALQTFAGILAKYIARYPQQWLVLDKAFCEDNS